MSGAQQTETPLAVELLGWAGMICITLAFVLNARGVVDDGLVYQGMNAAGASALLVLCTYKRDWPTFTLELVWLAVSIVGLARCV